MQTITKSINYSHKIPVFSKLVEIYEYFKSNNILPKTVEYKLNSNTAYSDLSFVRLNYEIDNNDYSTDGLATWNLMTYYQPKLTSKVKSKRETRGTKTYYSYWIKY